MKLPPIPASFQEDQRMFLRTILAIIDREVSGKIDKVAPAQELLLASPSKKIYSIKVDDAGDLQMTLVQE